MRPAPYGPPAGQFATSKARSVVACAYDARLGDPLPLPPSAPLTSPLVPLAHLSVSSYPIGRVPSVLPPTATALTGHRLATPPHWPSAPHLTDWMA